MDERFDVSAAAVGLAFAVLGVLFLLEATDVSDFRFEIVLPAMAIVVGLAVILGALVRDRGDT